MNPEEYLQKVERAIVNRPRTGTRSYCIVLVNGDVFCRPTRGAWPIEYNLGRFTDRQLERGLSDRQWRQIKARITSAPEGQTK